MAQSSFPFQSVDTTETQYSQLFRLLTPRGHGINGVPGDTTLKASANSSGMNVTVTAGQAIVRGHMYISTATETLAIQPSEANPRIDTVVLTLDPTANSIVLAVVKGTAAVSPSAPSLTQTDTGNYQFALANVAVAASATTISAGNVTDRREFIDNVWTTATRPTPRLGLIGINTTTSQVEWYNGTAWVDVAPTALDASIITTGLLPISRGGTGAATVSAARAALDAAQTAHTHAIADVNTLQTALDGKAAASHTHVAANITDQSNINAGRLNGIKIFGGTTTPTGASAGDYWLN